MESPACKSSPSLVVKAGKSEINIEKGFHKEKEPLLGHCTLLLGTPPTREVHLDGRKVAESSTDSSVLQAVPFTDLSVLLSIKSIHKQQRSGGTVISQIHRR